MINDEELYKNDAEMTELFLPMTQSDRLSTPNPQRIEKIIDKALYETVVKDTTSFVFNSFGQAIASLTGAVLGARPTSSIGVRKDLPYHNTPPSGPS